MTQHRTLLWRTSVVALFGVVWGFKQHTAPVETPIDAAAMLDASVSIATVSHVHIDPVGDSVWRSGTGSGFVVSRQPCRIWTNAHVVRGAAFVEVRPRNWNRTAGIGARVVGVSPRADFAILEADSCQHLTPAQLGDSERIAAGDEAYAVGNPLGRNPDSISRGIVSHTERYLHSTVPYLQTDAAINPGNSGGALFNAAGEVIGMNTAIAHTRGGANVGVGYALPINEARATARRLAGGPVSWPRAGIEDDLLALTADEAVLLGIDGSGAVVYMGESPSAPAGDTIARHDIIHRIDGQAVTDLDAVTRIIGAREVGDVLAVDLLRRGDHRRVQITLREGAELPPQPGAELFSGHLGMDLEMWSGHDDERGRFTRPVITRVYGLGPAHRARIKSTQKTIGRKGPFMFNYLLDAKVVTGVVRNGEFTPVSDVATVQRIAAAAHAGGDALLVEVQLWERDDPADASTGLVHERTVFYRLEPAPAAARPDDFAVLAAGGERPSTPEPLVNSGFMARLPWLPIASHGTGHGG